MYSSTFLLLLPFIDLLLSGEEAPSSMAFKSDLYCMSLGHGIYSKKGIFRSLTCSSFWLVSSLFLLPGKVHWKFNSHPLDSSATLPHCLKMTQNVSFDLFNFGIFQLFDPILQFFKNSPNWKLNETFLSFQPLWFPEKKFLWKLKQWFQKSLTNSECLFHKNFLHPKKLSNWVLV